jgi:hypothetical protein
VQTFNNISKKTRAVKKAVEKNLKYHQNNQHSLRFNAGIMRTNRGEEIACIEHESEAIPCKSRTTQQMSASSSPEGDKKSEPAPEYPDRRHQRIIWHHLRFFSRKDTLCNHS